MSNREAPPPPGGMNGEHGELWTRIWHLHEEVVSLKSEQRVSYGLMFAILLAVIGRWLT